MDLVILFERGNNDDHDVDDKDEDKEDGGRWAAAMAEGSGNGQLIDILEGGVDEEYRRVISL